MFPHIDQILRGQADFFAVHANKDAAVGLDGKYAAEQAVLSMATQQLARRRNPVAKKIESTRTWLPTASLGPQACHLGIPICT